MDSTTGVVTHYYQKPGRYLACVRISDPVSGQSDEYCNYVFTKYAVGFNDILETAISMNVFPNPIVETLTISYFLPSSQNLELTVYDQLGRRIETLLNEGKNAGNHQFTWDPGSAPSGIYYLKLIAEEGIITKQLVITK
jgi:hypothetical protein